MSFAAFVEDGDRVDGGAGGVCWDWLAGTVGGEGDLGGADEPNLYLLLVSGTWPAESRCEVFG